MLKVLNSKRRLTIKEKTLLLCYNINYNTWKMWTPNPFPAENAWSYKYWMTGEVLQHAYFYLLRTKASPNEYQLYPKRCSWITPVWMLAVFQVMPFWKHSPLSIRNKSTYNIFSYERQEEYVQNQSKLNLNWLAGFHFSNCTFNEKKYQVKLPTNLSKATHQC